MAKGAKSGNSCVELPDDDDRISNLPAFIRCHILSFLPTKNAVATTVLSTKWNNLWTTAVCNIEFYSYLDDLPDGSNPVEEIKEIIKFSQAVNKVLLFHNLPVIKRFVLCCMNHSLYDVYSWVTIAIRKKVEYLDLCIQIENTPMIQLPSRLFTCDTLEVLKLEGHIYVRVLTLYSLPKLKKLELLSIQYQNEASVGMLISSCPSLESLDIVRVMDDGVENFSISSSTLKTLRMEQDYCWFRNLVINTPGLQHLELTEGSVGAFVMENVQSLVKADIQLNEEVDGILSCGDNFSNLLQGICNSKILKIGLTFESAIPPLVVPKFDSLSSLELEMRCCNWHLLQEFIKNSDRLEALKFEKGPCFNRNHPACCWRNPKTVPICLLLSLRTMTYSDFEGLKDELMMVEYILKNAKVMQKMDIHFKNRLGDTEPIAELRRKLLKFSKGSEECQVIIRGVYHW